MRSAGSGAGQSQPIVSGVSIPPSLDLPAGVTAVAWQSPTGPHAALDNASAVEGRGPGLRGSAVLVPGFTGSKEDFLPLLAPLAERGVRAVAFDLTGQFETPGPADVEHYSLAGFAADVWAVAASLPRPLVLVGHSFGGLVVREAVLANPLACDGLAIVASGPASLPESQHPMLQQFQAVLRTAGLEAVWQGKRALEQAAGLPLPEPEIDDFLTRRFLSNSPGSLQAMIEILLSTEDRVDALAALAPPTVVVIGERDDAWPVSQQRSMAERLECATVVLPDAGHSPAIDAPDEVAAAIAALYDA